ncbi:MAG: peptidylprolyl isomerase [Clostridiales Family XIII bacterium]|jgi:peptidyl-prolyl cis-trans isomerase B (cyclophilin B)|nr:peptidylprolyl isomerase [Clostridiales Family XIII bacterium]
MKMTNKSRLVMVLAFAFASGALLAGCGTDGAVVAGGIDAGSGAVAGSGAESGGSAAASETGGPVVEITMEGGGTIDIALDAEAAPITTANFLKLVDAGFYDGLTFHRIIPGFMIQGGDPEGTGMGGADEEIKGEFADNGWDNPISHKRGVISMARSQSPNSASSQFFITNADADFLDGQYAAFGTVISGMDVVDEISAAPTKAGDAPESPVVIKTIRRAS